MKITNLMEEAVIKEVNELFDEEKKLKKIGLCTCYQCRLDVACYVLNKIPPKYVVSGRGLVYIEKDYYDNYQKNVDIVTLAREGMEIVTKTKRPHAEKHSSEEYTVPKGPVFNMPIITGRIFNGKNFEPAKNIEISLYSDNKLVKMMDPNWQNPYKVVENTAGNYLFWPYPASANTQYEKKMFDFEIRIELKDFENINHFFKINLKADEICNEVVNFEHNFKIEDLYLFPKGEEEEL